MDHIHLYNSTCACICDNMVAAVNKALIPSAEPRWTPYINDSVTLQVLNKSYQSWTRQKMANAFKILKQRCELYFRLKKK